MVREHFLFLLFTCLSVKDSHLPSPYLVIFQYQLFDKEVEVLCQLTCGEIVSVALFLQVVQVVLFHQLKAKATFFIILYHSIKHIAKTVGKTSGSPTELAREGFKTRRNGSISKVFAEQA